MIKIPSEEDFARAKKLMAERFRHLETVRLNVRNTFSKKCPLYDVYLLPEGDSAFRMYVFYNKDEDVMKCDNDGTSKALADYVYSELERVGRGKRNEIKVVFEFDSDENVTNKYNGDYYGRLH